MRTPWSWLVVLAACGGASSDGPLTVPIGVSRDTLAGELRRFDFCPGANPPAATETFRRCDAPGHEFSVSWVIAHFEARQVWKIQRFERYSEEQRGLERWNALIEQRAETSGPPSAEAKAQLAAQQPLPDGTKTWVAFRAGDTTLVGVYLLNPRPPEYATILEEIVVAGHVRD